jgi:hypothetical protein
MCVRTYGFSREFYEATRDLGSPPPPRTNRVEACRPQGCLVLHNSVASATRSVRQGRARLAPGKPAPPATSHPRSGRVALASDAVAGPLRGTSTYGPEGSGGLWWRGLTPLWPRSLRLGTASGNNLCQATLRLQEPRAEVPAPTRKIPLGAGRGLRSTGGGVAQTTRVCAR